MRLFNAKEDLRGPEILRNFERPADQMNCFTLQCVHWRVKHVPGAQVAGNGWIK